MYMVFCPFSSKNLKNLVVCSVNSSFFEVQLINHFFKSKLANPLNPIHCIWYIASLTYMYTCYNMES